MSVQRAVALAINAAIELSRQGYPGFGRWYANALRRGPAAVVALWQYFEREWPSAASQAAKNIADLQWGTSE